MSYSTTHSSHFNSYPINTSIEKDHSVYESSMSKIYNKLISMLEKHSKIMIVRFDIRYPNDRSITYSKEHIYDFTYNIRRSLNREQYSSGHLVDAQTIYVEEQDSSEYPHYHFAVIVNANATKSAYTIHMKANDLWKKALNTSQDGLVHFCNEHPNGLIIERYSSHYQDQFSKVFYQLSYLAKTRGKENRPKGTWLIKCSH